MSSKKFRPKFQPIAAAIVASCIFLPMSVSLSADPDPRAKAQQEAREFASDAMITARVKTSLLTDKRVDGLQIDVDTKNGVVTLKGEVDDAAQIDHAEKLAAEVQGVESVSNSLVVGRDSVASNAGAKGNEKRTLGRAVDDGIITGKVKTALVADAEIKGLMIDVDTNRGVVTLSGQVETKAQLDKVMKIAGQTEGVNAVNNQLSVKNVSKPSRGGMGHGEMNLARAEAAKVRSVDNELIAHRLFDSSPLARYRPLPHVPNPVFDAMTPGSI
ncbi:MAG: BON domain-containing protein [Burkholderiales bacterium]|nr:BON domain-containing protein [Burkholderiales bacterium]